MRSLKAKINASPGKTTLAAKQQIVETVVVPKLQEVGIQKVKVVKGHILPQRNFPGGESVWVDSGDLIYDVFGEEYGLSLITDKDFSAEISARYRKSGDKLVSHSEKKEDVPKKKSIDSWLK